MSVDEIKIKVKDSLKRLLEIGEQEVTDQEDLNQLGMDSMSSVNLVVELEEMFDIVFDDEELLFENFSTVQKITDIVERKLVLPQ
ncbi:acyl carrier protein [Paenibacillus lautus]|uniref:acyl carrier protein n=1 Tax=Paenibacillus lautus TaxID=1401 RepID=UPI003D2D651C